MKKETEFIQTIGRRKSAVAIVKFFPKEKGEIIINGKNFKEYFPIFSHQKNILLPFEVTNFPQTHKFEIMVRGGGKNAQSEAVRLGISRALVKFDEKFKPVLKSVGLLKRDPREKERKKFGLKRARRAPQWQKR